jgi:hypothetical protein
LCAPKINLFLEKFSPLSGGFDRRQIPESAQVCGQVVQWKDIRALAEAFYDQGC